MTPATWFYDLGVLVFPTANKVPAVPKGTSQFDYHCSRQQAAMFTEYGVPLGVFAVADTDSPQSEAWATAHLPDTPFKVRTGRGVHRYYNLTYDAPHFLHRDGLTIEFRHRGQYVVGPGSVRPDGVRYVADAWSWNVNDVPFFPDDFQFDDRPPGVRGSSDGQPLALPDVVHGGERHDTLHRVMRSLVAHGLPLDAALTACFAVNRERCRPPLDENDSLTTFLRRAYQQKDRADFVRVPKVGWELAAALLDVGLSVPATIVAVRSVTPDFDPEHADE